MDRSITAFSLEICNITLTSALNSVSGIMLRHSQSVFPLGLPVFCVLFLEAVLEGS